MSARPRPRAAFLLAAAFILVYFGARRIGVADGICEAMTALPAAYAALVHARRALGSAGAARRQFGLLALSSLLWVGGQTLWALSVVGGRSSPGSGPGPVIDLLFLGFLAPALAASLLGPAPRLFRPDLIDRLDAGLLVMAQVFVFLRLVFFPLANASGGEGFRALLLATLCLALAAVSSARFRFADVPGERRVYGLVALFAVTYGVGSAMGNGVGPMPLPGTVLDIVWFVPFFILSSAASEGRRPWPALPRWGLLVAMGPLPLLLDLFGHVLWPGAHDRPEMEVLLSFAALVGLACALRLGLQESRDTEARRRDRERLEEERRSGRLDSLQAVSVPLLADLRRGLEFLAFRSGAAASALGAEAPAVGQQVERAQGLLAGIEASLGPGRLAPPQEVNVPRLVEETLQAEVDAGLPIRVRLSAASWYAPVMAEPRSLGAAFRELARNAAQASPGGSLEVRVERDDTSLVIRFRDDGPGIPEDIRRHVFDPFFSTRPRGAGVGLGLTLVHFVARDLGGSARLESGAASGAEVALRLPLADGRSRKGQGQLLVSPLLATAALAIVTAAIPDATAAARFGRGAASAAALLAGLQLARAARHEGVRRFFALLALGATLLGLGSLLVRPTLAAFADWPLAAAVLLPLTAAGPRAVGRPALRSLVLVAFLAVHLGLVVVASLGAGAEGSAGWVAGGALRLLLAVAARALAVHAGSDEGRRFLDTLSVALVFWAVATSAPGLLESFTSLRTERLFGLAVVPSLLLLFRLGRDEVRRGRRTLLPAGEPGTRDLSARGAGAA